MLNAVVDTNVFISALLSETGTPAKLLDAWRDGRFAILITTEIIEEINEVLGQPKFQKKHATLPKRLVDLNTLLREHALYIELHSDVRGSVPADPDDEIFLAAAVDGQADVIVSGDTDLLRLKIFRGIPIITPRQFFEIIES